GRMECPKCGYLGFDETPRCRNCSYDFALVSTGDDLALDAIDAAISDARPGSPEDGVADWARTGALDAAVPAAGPRAAFDVSDLDALLQKAEATGVTAPVTDRVMGDGPPPAAAGPALPDFDLDALLPGPGPVATAPPEPPAFGAFEAFDRAFDTAFAPAALPPADLPPTVPPPPAAQLAPPPVPAPADAPVAMPDVLTWPVAPPLPVRTERAREDGLRTESRVPAWPRPALDVAALDDDRPLVTLQQPRAPIAVRKTPMSPKLRAVSRPTPQEPAFDFFDHADAPAADAGRAEGERPGGSAAALESGPPLRRLAATAVDAVLFAGIDLAVLYLTFRIVGLGVGEWRVLPIWPIALFLVGMKLAYVAVFTALGGQTIGKMAAGIRVVSMEDRGVSAGTAVRRTLASLVAVATAGLTYLPGLLGRERRAIHDRVSGTRVVLLPAA
ncbi:MAG: RDD family protein, partial [Vicinamibacterales bacterium]